MTTDLFRSQHAQIMLLLIQLDGLLLSRKLPDCASEFRRVLAELQDRLTAHTVAEETLLYPNLLSCPDAASRELAEQFESEMNRMSREFRTCVRRWLAADAIESQHTAFILEARAMTKALLERIRRENAQLLPLADQLSGRGHRSEFYGRRTRALPVLALASNA